jgi:alkanesulfonate monooxygenase SsuD/methylene tetrahydromethanopterin reductase-like flavin-dependent oxidoreductase (luciferase family)
MGFAAAHAELIFTAQNTLADGQRFYADIRARAVAAGRDADALRVMPACFVVVGATDEAAHEKLARLDAFVDEHQARAALGVALGTDAAGFDLDAPLPDLPPSNASLSARKRATDLATAQGFTAGQLGRRLAGYGALSMVGSATTIVDQMQAWFEGEACDGFIILFSDLPEGLDDFVDLVVPELRRRGLFRLAYEGTTLRDHLGLERIPNRRFAREGDSL